MPISGEKTRRIRERGILGAVGLDEERGTSRGLVASFSFRFSFSPRNFFYNRLVIILCTLDARTRTILFHLPGEKWTKNCGRIGNLVRVS